MSDGPVGSGRLWFAWLRLDGFRNDGVRPEKHHVVSTFFRAPGRRMSATHRREVGSESWAAFALAKRMILTAALNEMGWRMISVVGWPMDPDPFRDYVQALAIVWSAAAGFGGDAFHHAKLGAGRSAEVPSEDVEGPALALLMSGRLVAG